MMIYWDSESTAATIEKKIESYLTPDTEVPLVDV
jgi:hypothetical protein